ncbi:MAG: His/Gly/Thr/Pro-type tRNA ligase C-terminal domain-containing protein [Nitrospira sp.]|jgi:threonyl-tRNA synthetase
MLVVGDKEVQSGMVSVRGRSGANHGSLPIEAFLELLRTDANQTLRQTATHSQTR